MKFFNIKKFFKSLKFALKGISSIYKTEQNFRFQVWIALLVVFFMVLFSVTLREVIVLVAMITFVLVMEIINSAFEKITDMLKPRIHVYAEIVKNIMSGAVLIVSFSALIIGIIIFYPYFIKLLLDL